MAEELVDIVLRNGEILEGYTLFRRGKDSVTVGYAGHEEDPAVDPAVIGIKREIPLADIVKITPVG